ncbi:protein CNPPD1 [Bacillus rossius redtenbacheri]|uniref:protein CNPPD1 n=1 Tax=Bacillus rossius redtenbacheri TaxID=93214 RepID=UPI002FDE762D
MPVFSAAAKRKRYLSKSKFKVAGDRDRFLSRIEKSLYYGKLPLTDRFSLPVSELAAELFTRVKESHSLDHLPLADTAAISRNSCASPCSLVLALLYVERLNSCNPGYLRTVPSSQLFVVSMMVASKFLNDDGEEDEVFNDEWAAATGLSLKDLNRIEHDFLQAINWEVFVSEQTFWKKLRKLEAGVANREGWRRGWFTYADLDKLLDELDLLSVAHTLFKVSTVFFTSYTAGVLTLLGSVLIASHVPGTSLGAQPSALSTTAHCDLLHGPGDPPSDEDSNSTASVLTLLDSVLIASRVPGTSLGARQFALSTTAHGNLLHGPGDPPSDEDPNSTASVLTLLDSVLIASRVPGTSLGARQFALSTTAHGNLLHGPGDPPSDEDPNSTAGVFIPESVSCCKRLQDEQLFVNETVEVADMLAWLPVLHSWLRRTSLDRCLHALRLSLAASVA